MKTFDLLEPGKLYQFVNQIDHVVPVSSHISINVSANGWKRLTAQDRDAPVDILTNKDPFLLIETFITESHRYAKVLTPKGVVGWILLHQHLYYIS